MSGMANNSATDLVRNRKRTKSQRKYDNNDTRIQPYTHSSTTKPPNNQSQTQTNKDTVEDTNHKCHVAGIARIENTLSRTRFKTSANVSELFMGALAHRTAHRVWFHMFSAVKHRQRPSEPCSRPRECAQDKEDQIRTSQIGLHKKFDPNKQLSLRASGISGVTEDKQWAQNYLGVTASTFVW